MVNSLINNMVFKISPKLEVIIRIIIIIFLLVLNLAIFLNGINIDCDKCNIIIKEHIPGKTDYIQNLSINELYNEIKDGVCKRWIG